MIYIKFIPIIYTFIFAGILAVYVPRSEIRKLSVYGITFGAFVELIVITIGISTGSFKYINYEPFGLFGMHFFAPISWAIFFVLFFYFLPDKKVYVYIYVFLAVCYAMLFCQMITKLGVLKLGHGIIDSIVPFAIWFPAVTWGYLKLTKNNK